MCDAEKLPLSSRAKKKSLRAFFSVTLMMRRNRCNKKYLAETGFSPNENVIVWLTEFPLMLAISFNFLNTPPAVRLAGWNIIRWLLRELSATRPKSPFSCASALTLSNCRPGNDKADGKWWQAAGGWLPSPMITPDEAAAV